MIRNDLFAGGLAPPVPSDAVTIVTAPSIGAGAWAGSPSALAANGAIYLAYRLRTPGRRGYAVVVARSDDGLSFRPVVTIGKAQLGAESLERPALAVAADGSWRLYLSCATPGTKHWRVELIEAGAPDEFDPANSRVVAPGDGARAVKDPVIVSHGGAWHMWASVHPLADPGQSDRMTTEYATSSDGIDWTWHGVALAPRPGEWDARGVRVAAVRWTPDGVSAYYDGRATAAENCEERTGVAIGPAPGSLTAVGVEPIAESPAGRAESGGRGLRYVTVVPLADGRERVYYELTNASGSHDLVTELRTA